MGGASIGVIGAIGSCPAAVAHNLNLIGAMLNRRPSTLAPTRSISGTVCSNGRCCCCLGDFWCLFWLLASMRVLLLLLLLVRVVVMLLSFLEPALL